MQFGRIREVLDRKYRLEYGLQALVQPPAARFVAHQELVVGRLLNLDEVRHLRHFLDMPEELANAFATGERLLRHSGLSFRRPSEANLPKRDWHRPRVEFDSFAKSEAQFQDLSPECAQQTFKPQNDARGA